MAIEASRTHVAVEGRYGRQPYRRTGRSGLDLPAFSFGLWQKFGVDHAFATQRAIILHAFDLGITHFDNADRYGPPHRGAQQTFGRVLGTDLARYRDELVLSTKAGGNLGPGPYLKGGLRKALLTSLDHYLPDRTCEIARLLRAAGVPLLVHQARYSIYDRRPEQAGGLLAAAAEDGFGVVAYSPLAQGLLTGKYLDAIPDGARAGNSEFPDG